MRLDGFLGIKNHLDVKAEHKLKEGLIIELINKLSDYKSSDIVYNPFSEKIQKENMRTYLLLHLNYNPKYLLIGEASGYKGCRYSGIAFTSGFIIANHKIFNNIRYLYNYNLIQSKKENSAQIVHSFYEKHVSEYWNTILWNAFPFHPHKKEDHTKNRTPSNKELEIGREYLIDLCKIFEFKTICPIGNRAYETLVYLQSKQLMTAFPLQKIRHPSFGGKNQFMLDMDQIYK